MPNAFQKCIRFAVLLPSLLTFSGCSIRQPLLVRDQARLISQNDKRLKAFAEPVQKQLASTGKDMALVVVGTNPAVMPDIYPTGSPLAAALEHHQEVASGQTCVLVFKRSLPLPPERMSCSVLAHDSERLQQLLADAQQAKREIAEVEKVIGPMAALVEYHEHQLKSLDTTLHLLVDDYGKTTKAIETNNGQVEALILDSNREFAQIRQILNQTQQKLRNVK